VLTENLFSRILDNKTYYFEFNQLICFTKNLKTKFISKLKPSKNFTENFLTLDIETFKKDNGVLVPFLISIYDGSYTKSFYITDYNSVEDLVTSAIKSIMIEKYNK
jgi:hypothetical protein